MTFIIGIDPGVPLTLGLLDSKGKWVGHAVACSPEGLKQATRHNEPEHFVKVLYQWKKAAGPNGIRAVIEGVSPRPREGVVSVGKFMGSFWMAKTGLSAFRIPYEIVWPQKWKPALDLDDSKAKSIALAKKKWPERAWRLKHYYDHNFAEAALLAHYYRNTLQQTCNTRRQQ